MALLLNNMNENSLAVFEEYKIRRVYDEGSETVTKCTGKKRVNALLNNTEVSV